MQIHQLVQQSQRERARTNRGVTRGQVRNLFQNRVRLLLVQMFIQHAARVIRQPIRRVEHHQRGELAFVQPRDARAQKFLNRLAHNERDHNTRRVITARRFA